MGSIKIDQERVLVLLKRCGNKWYRHISEYPMHHQLYLIEGLFDRIGQRS